MVGAGHIRNCSKESCSQGSGQEEASTIILISLYIFHNGIFSFPVRPP